MATFTDTFNGAAPDLSYTILNGSAPGITTTSGRGTCSGSFASVNSRANVDTGSADMFAELEIAAAFADSDRSIGVFTRCDGTTSVRRGYLFDINQQNQRYRFGYFTAGTYTNITGFVSFTFTAPCKIRLESEGNQHRVYIGNWTDEAGKNAALVATYTNAGLTTGNYGGIDVYNGNNSVRFDNYLVGDLAPASTTHNRSITDTIGVTDAAARTATATRSPSDPVGLVDTATRTATSARPLADQVGVTDSVAVTTGTLHTRDVADTIGVTDALARTVASTRSVVDPVGISDALRSSFAFVPLNVSLWAVTGSGVLAPLPAFQQLEISRERNAVGSFTIEYPAAAPGFAHLRAAVTEDRPVEVEVWLGGSRAQRLRGLITQTVGDDLDRTRVWRFAGQWLEQILADGIVHPQPAPAERGELRFDAKNAGEIVLTVLQQAQARGALTGVTRDWTTALDSSGQPWPSTISGLTYSPKTDLLAILQDLVEKDFCEFELTPDRVLRLWAPDRRGTNRTAGAEPTLFRWGRVSSSPLRHSTRDTVTAVLAVGKDGLSATASDASAQARIGRRIEVGVDAGNVDNQGALTAYAQAALAALTRGQEEIRHPLTFSPGDPRPAAGYDLADRVLSERAGGVRRAVDVQQWTLTASRQRATGGEVVLNDLIQSRLQRLARQVERITSGGAVIGTSEPDDDGLAPAAPTGVTVDSEAYTVGIDTYATLIVGWAPVVTNSDGSATDDVAGYRVEWRPSSDPTNGWRFGQDTTNTSTAFGGVDSGVNVLVRVAAYDRDGNTSEWSDEVVILTEVDDTAPPAPATPTAVPYLGQIKVGYNGLGSSNEAMPLDTDRIELEKALAAAFTDAQVVDTFSPNIPGERVLTDLDYGVTVYVRLVAVDRQGNRSPYSASASAVPGKVVGDDIFAGAVGSLQLADLAVVNAKIALLAVNDANVGNLSVGKLTAGTLSVAVTNAGIVRSGTTGQRYELDAASLRFYNSSGTQTVQLNGSLNWILGELRTGLSGTRLIANPDGANPDRIDFYPSSGSFKAMLQTRTFNGQALIELIGGTNRGDLAAGQTGAHPLEGYIRWGLPESVTPYSVALCRQFEVEMYGPHMRLAVSERYSNGGAGTRRIQFEHRNSSGATINESILHYQRNNDDQPWLAAPTSNSGIYFGPNFVGVVQNGGNGTYLVATDVVPPSSQELKDDITDARALIGNAIAAVRATRPVTYKYTADRWRTPAPTDEDPNPEPVPVPEEEVPLRLGILAEQAPPILQERITLPDGSESLGVSMVAQLNLHHQAIAQIGDQEIRSVAGRAQVPAGLHLAGREIDIPVAWDEPPLLVPTGGIVTVQAAVAWLGRATARIVPGTLTVEGCTVRVRILTAVTPSLINPILVEAQALYLWSPPFNPSETP